MGCLESTGSNQESLQFLQQFREFIVLPKFVLLREFIREWIQQRIGQLVIVERSGDHRDHLPIRWLQPPYAEDQRSRDDRLLLRSAMAGHRRTLGRGGRRPLRLESARSLDDDPPQALGIGHARRDALRAQGLPRSSGHH